MKPLSFLLLFVSCIACTKTKDRSYIICGHVSDTLGVPFSKTDLVVNTGNYDNTSQSQNLAEFITDSSGDFCIPIDASRIYDKRGLCIARLQTAKPYFLRSERIDPLPPASDTIKLGNITIKPYQAAF